MGTMASGGKIKHFGWKSHRNLTDSNSFLWTFLNCFQTWIHMCDVHDHFLTSYRRNQTKAFTNRNTKKRKYYIIHLRQLLLYQHISQEVRSPSRRIYTDDCKFTCAASGERTNHADFPRSSLGSPLGHDGGAVTSFSPPPVDWQQPFKYANDRAAIYRRCQTIIEDASSDVLSKKFNFIDIFGCLLK